ncbi:MAG: hypothetical protein QGG12_03905, partial [Prochlorococcaceae cyanobacterium ETNP18_MAG_14]|nr:hypothetical protein [Prochlorococcaceae cyanobacterium ETNP18_MAG_14]
QFHQLCAHFFVGQARQSLALLKGLVSELGKAWRRHGPGRVVFYFSGLFAALRPTADITFKY